jgi:hypothetical protein
VEGGDLVGCQGRRVHRRGLEGCCARNRPARMSDEGADAITPRPPLRPARGR